MKVTTLIQRIIQQMFRDKRTLILMMVAPLIVLTILNFLFETNNRSERKVGVYQTNTTFNQQLEKFELEVVEYKNANHVKQKIEQDQLVGFIKQENNKIEITYENSNPADTAELKVKIQGVFSNLKITNLTKQLQILEKGNQNKKGLIKQDKLTLTDYYIYGDKETSYFDTISPTLIGFFVFLFVFFISGIALLRERTMGTLDRLLATPIRRGEIVIGYLFGYGLFAIIQTLIVITFAVYILGIEIKGNLTLVILINILIALIALSMGILLSTFANSEFQMMQFIPLVIIPQIFFAGLFPVENMVKWLQTIAYFMPLYYGGRALQDVMMKGFTFSDIQQHIVVLILFGLVFLLLNVIGLKRYRKI